MLKNFLVLIFFIFISCSDNNEEELLKSIKNCAIQNFSEEISKGNIDYEEAYDEAFKNCELSKERIQYISKKSINNQSYLIIPTPQNTVQPIFNQ